MNEEDEDPFLEYTDNDMRSICAEWKLQHQRIAHLEHRIAILEGPANERWDMVEIDVDCLANNSGMGPNWAARLKKDKCRLFYLRPREPKQ